MLPILSLPQRSARPLHHSLIPFLTSHIPSFHLMSFNIGQSRYYGDESDYRTKYSRNGFYPRKGFKSPWASSRKTAPLFVQTQPTGPAYMTAQPTGYTTVNGGQQYITTTGQPVYPTLQYTYAQPILSPQPQYISTYAQSFPGPVAYSGTLRPGYRDHPDTHVIPSPTYQTSSPPVYKRKRSKSSGHYAYNGSPVYV